MTKFVTYSCDRCDKEFSYDKTVEWGRGDHYCINCAKLEISDLLNGISARLSKLQFNDADGLDCLEGVYGHIRLAMCMLDDRRKNEKMRVKE